MSKWIDRKPPPTEEQAENMAKGLWKDGRKPTRMCSAKNSTNGLPCKRPPIQGATVCRTHGGAAPHVKAAAKARIENASLLLAKELLGMALDPDMAPAVKLAAIKDALDRGGLGARAALDVVHELKPWQTIFEGIDRDAMDDAPTVVEGSVVPAEWGEFDDGRSA